MSRPTELVSKKYVASLALAAILTLVIGAGVRRWLEQTKTAPTPVTPPTEAAALQQLSQEGQVRRFSSFLNERARDVAALVEFVPSTQASGLRWRERDVLITTSRDRPIAALRVEGDTTRRPTMAPSDSLRGEWALVVARRPDGGFVSTAGVLGGRLHGTCAERDVSEYVIGTPLLDGFAGAGIFDLAGRVVGIVARCGDRLAALPNGEVTRLLTAPDSSGDTVSSRFGFAAAPLSADARRYFRTDSGLLVTAVTDDSPADRAGWVPGDVIAGLDDVRIDGSDPTATLDSLWRADSHVVVIRRGRSRLTTQLTVSRVTPSTSTSPTDAGLSFDNPPPGVAIDDVRTGSAAERAGMRRGDRLLSVGGTPVTSGPQARRLLERIEGGDTLTFIVFHRDSVARGVLLAR